MHEAELSTLKILGSRPCGPSMLEVTLDAAGAGLHATYTRAGQYLRVRAPGHDAVAYLALASAPSDGSPFHLLLQRGGEAVDTILAHLQTQGTGATLECSAAEGEGFGLEAQAGRNLLLFAGGSGISAIRSVLRETLAHPERFGPVTLFHGVRSPEHLAYRADHPTWEAAGVRLYPVVSREAPAWEGLRGHLQEHLGAIELEPERSSAFLCGPKAMQEALTERLLELGLERDRVCTNF